MTIASIDFASLYREHIAATRMPKSAEAWDARAVGMSARVQRSPYADEFIARMDLSDANTLLDVGCGPGTIGLLLAERLKLVYGLDFSRGMLDALMKNAAERGLSNVQAVHRAWEDDWSDVPECDIVVASRSTAVVDMATALAKLNTKALRRVYLTYLVGGHFVAPAVLEAIGRPQRAPQPDYIYVINILHGMNIHPRLDYIEYNGSLAGIANFEDLAERVTRVLGQLNEDESARLRAWYRGVGAGAACLNAPTRWAFISWEKTAP